MEQIKSLTTAILILVCVYCAESNPVATSSSTCQSCHNLVDGKINVHLVPHSHDDVGWLKTFTQYYYGTGNFKAYADAGVQYIISSTIKALKANPDRRFIQVETAFFWKWWLHQDNDTRQDVIDLVNSGQLEMVNGAWSMNDEAATNYQSIIDQFTWGFRILENTVGKCGRPKIGWQIDPFGHSREHASLLKQLGFEGLVIGRLDYRDKQRRKDESNLEFMWTSSGNLDNSELFTTMFPDFYVDEPGFHFDVMYGDTINDSNLKDKVERFAQILDNYRKYYKTSNVIMPMGNDFTYQVAERNFENIDKLIKGFENHPTYNLIYSTPSCYIKAVKDEVGQKSIQLENKSDDFFPYASDSHRFWTGYFTSRPTIKKFERTANNILQSVKQLTALSRMLGIDKDIYTLDLRQAMGVLQHHDAITGTEKQAVADDYSKMLYDSIVKNEEPLSEIILNILKKNDEVKISLNFSTCLLSNVSICSNSQKDRFVVAVQNPLSRIVTHYVRLPVDSDSYKITGYEGEEVYDIFDTIHSFDFIKTNDKISSKELVFAARDLPPLGIRLYYIEKTDVPKQYHPYQTLSSDTTFGNEVNGFAVDSTGMLTTVTIKGQTQEVTQEFLYYPTDSSGAYLFTPSNNEAQPMVNKSLIEVKFANGNLVDEYVQVVSDEISQIIRVYKDPNDAYIEFDWLVGNLQYVESAYRTSGKEVITRYTIKDFNNNKIFYTDSNGREQIKRELNTRSDYIYNSTEEPVSSNYYPITSKIVMKDEIKKMEVAVLTDRAQGGSSLDNGVVELMIHRKLTRDDGLGVGETLKEEQYGKGLYARGQHYLTFGSSDPKVENAKSTVAFERHLAQSKLLAPLVLVADATSENITLEKVKSSLKFEFEGLLLPLPDNVHLLTLEPWIDSYILRVEHIFEKDEDEDLSQPVTFYLSDRFALFAIIEIEETTLGANEFLKDTKILKDDLKITLNPMEIKTFIIKTDRNNKGGRDDSDGDDDIKRDSDSSAVTSTKFTLYLLVLLTVIMQMC